jgi:DNA-binding PadR family transcriptional regulator
MSPPPPLPELTHLQFLVLGLLLGSEQSGRVLRRELARMRLRRTGPAFYQMMARIEDAGWVDGFYTQQIVDGQIIKERWYRPTPKGVRAWTAARDFYLQTAERLGRQGVVHA